MIYHALVGNRRIQALRGPTDQSRSLELVTAQPSAGTRN